MGAADGAFGPPLAVEEDVPGHNGRRQRFKCGEIAWTPTGDYTVSVYRLRNVACFEWSKSRLEFGYDIIYTRSGDQTDMGLGLVDITISSSDDAPHFWTRLQGFGESAFILKNIGSEQTTIPVRVRLDKYDETPNHGGPHVSGVIADRWHELGAWDGWLGKPITHEDLIDGARFQIFERGTITTAPRFGPQMVVAAYQRGTSIEINWGGADIAYNAFRVDVYNHNTKRRVWQEIIWRPLDNWTHPWIGSGH